jgi:hypothetical protein
MRARLALAANRWLQWTSAEIRVCCFTTDINLGFLAFTLRSVFHDLAQINFSGKNRAAPTTYLSVSVVGRLKIANHRGNRKLEFSSS